MGLSRMAGIILDWEEDIPEHPRWEISRFLGEISGSRKWHSGTQTSISWEAILLLNTFFLNTLKARYTILVDNNVNNLNKQGWLNQ